MPPAGHRQLDARLIALLTEEPRIGVLEASRRLGVARGTVQARLDRLRPGGVVRGFGPEIDPAALGYPVTAFATLEIRQGRGGTSGRTWRPCPRCWRCTPSPAQGDMLCRIVARSNADLQRVIDRVVDFEGIVRTSTVIALENPVPLPGPPAGGAGRQGRPSLMIVSITVGKPPRTVSRWAAAAGGNAASTDRASPKW